MSIKEETSPMVITEDVKSNSNEEHGCSVELYDIDANREEVLANNVNRHTRVYYNTDSSIPTKRHNIAIQTSSLGIKFTIYLRGRELDKENLEERVERYRRCLYNFCCYVRGLHDLVFHFPESVTLEERASLKGHGKDVHIVYVKPQHKRNVRLLTPYTEENRENFIGSICKTFGIVVPKPALRIIRRKFRDRLYSVIKERRYIELYDDHMTDDRSKYIFNDEDKAFIYDMMDNLSDL